MDIFGKANCNMVIVTLRQIITQNKAFANASSKSLHSWQIRKKINVTKSGKGLKRKIDFDRSKSKSKKI